VEVWAISPDSPDKLASFASQEGIEFTLLSDGGQEAIRTWGIVNPKKPTVPHPTVVVVDREGVVRYLRQDIDYKMRPPASEVLEAVELID